MSTAAVSAAPVGGRLTTSSADLFALDRLGRRELRARKLAAPTDRVALLDPEDIHFRGSLTGYMWNHLTTAEQYEPCLRTSDICQRLLEEYIRTNAPVRLPEIIRGAK